MKDDYRDKIEQIRLRRNRETLPGAAPYDPNQAIGARNRGGVGNLGLGEVGDKTDGPDIMEGIKSPWSRDRVKLSLEGQIAMLEQRSQMRVNVADLGYTNRIPILSLRPGLFVKVEPPGTYRLVYHNR